MKEETSHSIFGEFRALKGDLKSLKPVKWTVIAYAFCIALVFGLGVWALHTELSWGSPKISAGMNWVADVLMFGSVILGFWKGIESPMISKEREICFIAKSRAEIRQGYLEEQIERFEDRGDTKSARDARSLLAPIKRGLNDVDKRLVALKASEEFSAKTLRAAIGFASGGMVVKGLSLMFT